MGHSLSAAPELSTINVSFQVSNAIQTIAIKIQKTQIGNYTNIPFTVNLIEVCFFFNFLLSLKDKQVDRKMLTLGSQADVDKAGRYHLTKNEILERSSSGKRHLREPKMKIVSREILSTQSLCQERPPQAKKEPTIYVSSNITHSLKPLTARAGSVFDFFRISS